MDRRVADSGSAGLSDTASYTARPPFALSLSLESRRQAERNRELMWRCNDIISYWDDKYRHTGRVTIPFKLLFHRSHIGNSSSTIAEFLSSEIILQSNLKLLMVTLVVEHEMVILLVPIMCLDGSLITLI